MNIDSALKRSHRPGIYSICCWPTGEIYIGGTKDLSIRLGNHGRTLKYGNHPNSKLQKASDEFGQEYLIVTLLEWCEASVLLEREQFWIDRLRPALNICPNAANSKGTHRSAASRQKMSAAAKGKHGGPRGPFSASWRLNMSLARKRNGVARGENSSTAKLKAHDVREIRKAHNNGVTQAFLRVKFGVSKSQISKIVSGKAWAHLTE